MFGGLGYLNKLGASGGLVFSPGQLFSGGEQGAWYDPSDLTTMFQNSAGTTPVTAVEQAVGLILDKSQGQPSVSADRIVNGNFASGTGWTLTGSAAITGGELVFVSGGSGAASQSLVFVGGLLSYSIRKTVLGASGAANALLRFKNGVTTVASVSLGGADGPRTYSGVLAIPSAIDAVEIFYNGTGTYEYKFDDLSVRTYSPGNHAYQSTDASRPTLRARYNLLTYSEQFDNAAWVKIDATISANATTAPDGTTTAELLYPSTTGSSRYINQIPASNAIATIYSFSIYAKAAGKNCGFLYLQNAANNGILYFDLSDATLQVVAGSSTTVTGSITNVGNGWYRIICTTAAGITFNGTSGNGIGVVDAKGSLNVTASGTNGLYIWGAQLLTAADNTTTGNAYQRIAAATDYVTTSTMGGYTFLPYLAFDGSDDSLLTNSVDFTGTDKMTVWSGVTKLSDGAIQCLYELSANTPSNNGTFVALPSYDGGSGFGAYWYVGSKGTTLANTRTAASFSAPNTVVQTQIANIGADISELRINAVQAATSSTDQGTGNYGNYPLYIGRRNNATLPYNGRLYSLIIRGAASNATQISATENWVASKTGVAL